MKPLRVAVIVKPTAHYDAREERNSGWWSYPVEPFTWEFIPLGKGKTVDTHEYKARGFDFIWHEDGGSWADYKGGALPIAYYSIDSTLSDALHYLPRKEQAAKADIVFVDHDHLDRFKNGSQPVLRASHCVNDRLFHPADKSLDVNFNCGGSPERRMYRVLLSEFCKARGLSYCSGAVPLADYARNLNRAKVVINVPRTPANRPHRTFDAMASGAALVTLKLPDVSGECRKAGRHYFEVTPEELTEKAALLVANGTWELIGLAGRKLVEQKHTWAIRAKELRELIQCAS